MLMTLLLGPSSSGNIQPKGHTATDALSVSQKAPEVSGWPQKLILAIQKLPPPEQARARQFLVELETKGWNGASPKLRDEFTPLFMEHFLLDELKIAIRAQTDHREWAKLSPDSQKYYTLLLDQARTLLIESSLATSKEQWDRLSTADRITTCSIAKCYLHAMGATEAEKSQYSVFLGDFMNTSASHVTLRDSVVVYCEQVRQHRRAQNLAALNEIVDLSMAGAQFLQVISQASE